MGWAYERVPPRNLVSMAVRPSRALSSAHPVSIGQFLADGARGRGPRTGPADGARGRARQARVNRGRWGTPRADSIRR